MIKPELTYEEAAALYSTAQQMEHDLEYYKFLGAKGFKKFCRDYRTAMEKLRVLIESEREQSMSKYLNQ